MQYYNNKKLSQEKLNTDLNSVVTLSEGTVVLKN